MQGISANKFGDASVLEFKTDLPIPEPSDDQVQIKVHAVGVNPYDGFVRAGYIPVISKFPFTVGVDAAGVVTKLGKNVKNFEIGDRVFLMHSDSGTYAEYATANAMYAFKLPDHYTFEEGSAIGAPYFTGTY
jgi:NADPH:quinone reductase